MEDVKWNMDFGVFSKVGKSGSQKEMELNELNNKTLRLCG
jgi:hypothetical protein